MNRSSKAIMGFDVASRGFAFYETIISLLLMLAGLMMGINLIDAEDAGLYGVTAVYLITISEFMQWILRQTILVESLMVSAARILQLRDLTTEK